MLERIKNLGEPGNSAVAKMIVRYESVVRHFILGQTTADTFEIDFLAQFRTDTNQVPSAEFDILDRLFTDVDEYIADPRLRAATGGIDENELRSRANRAYRQLYGEAR